MNRLSLPLARRSLARRRLCLLLLLGEAVSFPYSSQLHAQVGNNNPGGVSGIFNGNVTTGCSYDPYTGNATRAITDMVVARAVGEYPLALSRTSSSRSAWGNAFGVPGAWRHTYQWVLQDSVDSTNPNFQPTFYSVNFPDGRAMNFVYSASDPYFRSAAGIRHRFQPLNQSTCSPT